MTNNIHEICTSKIYNDNIHNEIFSLITNWHVKSLLKREEEGGGGGEGGGQFETHFYPNKSIYTTATEVTIKIDHLNQLPNCSIILKQ